MYQKNKVLISNEFMKEVRSFSQTLSDVIHLTFSFGISHYDIQFCFEEVQILVNTPPVFC